MEKESELQKLLRDVFDLKTSEEPTVDFKSIRSILQQKLHQFQPIAKSENSSTTTTTTTTTIENESEKSEQDKQEKTGRLGPKVVLMDKSSTGIGGGVKFFDDKNLSVEAMGNFSSIRANSCAYKGKWMYEATLVTSGIQQIGWATIDCPFTNEEGVGDAADSYAYDGKRIKKWSQGSVPYGQAWLPGDIIGCGLDLDAAQVLFYRNGTPLGVAFENIKTEEGYAYFPTISLSYGERCEFNFGGRPLEYPIEGFSPLQPPPPQWSAAKYLLQCWRTLLESSPSSPSPSSPSSPSPSSPSSPPTSHPSRNGHDVSGDDYRLVSSILFEFLGPLLMNEYVVVKWPFASFEREVGP
eukprot:TRINITY_DN1223_c0_g2_i2.p1 TRINITY_DN1223_c0_g2~~TRINITY_DN1223_c0_g2_i2.p1  ORF type:complete len:353 (-),score=121.72 TRINITY_DN1223_c0_g2_i2:628-1686(-)